MKQPAWVVEEKDGVEIRELEALAELSVTVTAPKSVVLVLMRLSVLVPDEESRGAQELRSSVASRPIQSTDHLMP